MDEMGIAFERLSASRYAGGLRAAARDDEPHKLLDFLLIGALIEARSCERFAKIAPRLPEKLGRFYGGLLASEAGTSNTTSRLQHRKRARVSDEVLNNRLRDLKAIEADLVLSGDTEFRFHSGTPI